MKNFFHMLCASLITSVCIAVLIPVSVLASDLDPNAFLNQVFESVKGFGGMPWTLKVAAILMLIIGSMKVSFLRGLIWDKLGWAKALVAPGLALAAGIFQLAGSAGMSLPAVTAYLFAGAGAIVLHELLDGLKLIPGIGPAYVAVIDVAMKILGGAKK